MFQPSVLRHILSLLVLTGMCGTMNVYDDGSGYSNIYNDSTSVTSSMTTLTYSEPATVTLSSFSMFTMTDLSLSSPSVLPMMATTQPSIQSSLIMSDFLTTTIQSSLSIMIQPLSTMTVSLATTIQSSSTTNESLTTIIQSSLMTATMIQSSSTITPQTLALTDVSISSSSSLLLATTSASVINNLQTTMIATVSFSLPPSTSPTPIPMDASVSSSLPPSTSPTPTPTDASVSSSLPSSTSPTPTPADSTSIWDTLLMYLMTPEGLAVAIGGPVIVLLVIIIIVVVCCYCICRKNKGRYDVGSEKYANGNLRYSNQRLSNSDPQDIQMTLKRVQMERQLITQSAGAGFHETDDLDDSLLYQGHSQLQHSQVYPQMPMEGLETPHSLSKLTPLHPSQIISQVQQIGQISVDDDENEDNVPVRDKHKHDTILSGDGSPFLHLSDNLSRHSSKSRIPSELNHTPLDQVVAGTGTQHSQYQDSSQLSYLGLGVRHASDVVVTNTESLLEEGDMTGLSTLGLERSTASRLRYSSASPLLSGDNLLDDTPVREKPSTEATRTPQTSGKPTNFALLTSLPSDADTPVKDTPVSQVPEGQEQGGSLGATIAKPAKKMSLVAMTSLPSKLESQEESMSASVEVASEVQEGPERQRRNTVAVTKPTTFSRTSKNTKLGKLTSLDYIRASLRKRLSTMKSKENRDKKPLKSALRKTNSISSNSSNESTPSHQSQGLTYANRYTHYDEFSGRDMSPHQVNYPTHMTSPDMMGSLDIPVFPGGPAYMGAPVPYNGREPYGYNGPPQLSPAMGYGQELSPILSVPFDYHDPQYSRHEIGILPPYGGPIPMMGDYQEQFPIPAASQYDDDDLPVLCNPYRQTGPMGGGPSQGQSQRVTWNLDHEEIPPRTPVDPEELTPSDIDEMD